MEQDLVLLVVETLKNLTGSPKVLVKELSIVYDRKKLLTRLFSKLKQYELNVLVLHKY